MRGRAACCFQLHAMLVGSLKHGVQSLIHIVQVARTICVQMPNLVEFLLHIINDLRRNEVTGWLVCAQLPVPLKRIIMTENI